MRTISIYKNVAITIQSAGNNHAIGLSITDAVRHKFGSYDEAMIYAIRWIDRLIAQ